MAKDKLNLKDWLNQTKHAGKTPFTDKWWHYEPDNNTYWSGSTHELSPKELFDACQSTILDLLINHPDLAK